MRKIFSKVIILFFLILSSCWREDDLLRNEREYYWGDNLRIDGFYYYLSDGKIEGVTFLYRNGIFFKVIGDGKERTTPDEVITLLTEEHIEYCKTHKDLWGIFKIKGNNILIERWIFAGLGWKTTVIESGIILNDTSFIITEWDKLRSGISDVHYEYFFYPYSHKPDSTNNFIK